MFCFCCEEPQDEEVLLDDDEPNVVVAQPRRRRRSNNRSLSRNRRVPTISDQIDQRNQPSRHQNRSNLNSNRSSRNNQTQNNIRNNVNNRQNNQHDEHIPYDPQYNLNRYLGVTHESRGRNRNHNLNLDAIQPTVTHQPRRSINNIPGVHLPAPAVSWKIHDLMQAEHNLTLEVAQQLEKLFSEGNTIPFIARHCKHIIGNMTTGKLRNVKSTYDMALALRQDILQKYNEISNNLGGMSESLTTALMNAKTRGTLDEILMPYQRMLDMDRITPGSLEMEHSADMILQGYYRRSSNSTDSILRHVAAKIGSSPGSVAFLQNLCNTAACTLSTARVQNNSSSDASVSSDDEDEDLNYNHNFRGYVDRSFNTKELRSHQILAINRAERKNILTVTLVFADFWSIYYKQMRQIYSVACTGQTKIHFDKSLDICYEYTAMPMLQRMKRAALTEFAEQEALEIFTSNLKQILLTTPVKNTRILGLDPGTSLGCKLGLISETGTVLHTGVIHHNAETKRQRQQQKQLFRNILHTNNCSLIAIGNGTGCRNAETWIADMIAQHYFEPLQVRYTIVNESGTSIYSCSQEANNEFGDMDPHHIGAISIARRVQDPLSELVKFEPRHMGIGMYQHDLDTERLEKALAEVVSECVSFVGVDINTASECLLRHVAGLSETLARSIVAYREQNGVFKERQAINAVGNITNLSYNQCVSFLKIFNGANKLDETRIHPDSYDIVHNIVQALQMHTDQIGSPAFRTMLQHHRRRFNLNPEVFRTSKEQLECIFSALLEQDDLLETITHERLYHSEIKKIEDLQVGNELTGAVVNVVTFGCFVDVGVAKEGLLHVSRSQGLVLRIGNRVKVEVCKLNIARKRIGLKLIAVL